jgi:cytochrome c biogenesis protein CcdA
MDFALPWPTSQGEWLAWSSAVFTVLLGLLFFLAPNLAFRILRLQAKPEKAAAIAEGRGRMSGFYLGVGLCCLLLGPQPFLYMALGFSWLFTAFGRLLSMMSDGANTPFNWVSIVVELALAALPLAFAFGFLP